MAREINQKLYRVNFYGVSSPYVVECCDLNDLYDYVAQKVSLGYICVSVSEICPDGSRPKVPVLTTKEYKKLLRQYLNKHEQEEKQMKLTNKRTYKITGRCPFGTCEVNENGQMDESQFSSSDPADYVQMYGAVLAIHVAQNYGAKPICQIETDFCTVDVYKISHYYGTIFRYPGQINSTVDIVWRNTVNPVAIVKCAWDRRPGDELSVIANKEG